MSKRPHGGGRHASDDVRSTKRPREERAASFPPASSPDIIPDSSRYGREPGRGTSPVPFDPAEFGEKLRKTLRREARNRKESEKEDIAITVAISLNRFLRTERIKTDLHGYFSSETATTDKANDEPHPQEAADGEGEDEEEDEEGSEGVDRTAESDAPRVHVIPGNGGKPRKSLIDILQDIPGDKNPFDDGKSTLDIGQRVIDRLQQHPDLVEDAITAADMRTIGSTLLRDTFGGKATSRIVRAFNEAYSPADQYSVLRIGSQVNTTSKELRAQGLGDLASFASTWAVAIEAEGGESVAKDIQLHSARVWLIQTWDKWSVMSRSDSLAISKFLTEKGFDAERHKTIQSRINSYLADRWQVKREVISQKIYMWRPLAMMVETFGRGVLALMPRTMQTSYKRMQGKKVGGPDSMEGLTKEAKLGLILDVLCKEVPGIKKTCEKLDKCLVRPLTGDGSPNCSRPDPVSVKGIELALNGEGKEMERMSLSELITPDMGGQPTQMSQVSELSPQEEEVLPEYIGRRRRVLESSQVL